MTHDINDWIQMISLNRKKIKDDFCLAYLAENMLDEIPIKNLVMNEQFKDGGYRWWFSVKDEEYMK